MNLSFRIRALAFAVALAMFSTGCIVIPGGGPYRRRHCSTTIESSGKLETVGTRTGSAVTISQKPASSEGGLREVHGGGEGALALLFALGVVIGVLIVVDIILLPATAPSDHAFCCTTTVVHHCCY